MLPSQPYGSSGDLSHDTRNTTHRAAKEERLLAQRLVGLGLLAADVVEREENVVLVSDVGREFDLNFFIEFRLPVGRKKMEG